jgi:hypothetical protein
LVGRADVKGGCLNVLRYKKVRGGGGADWKQKGARGRGVWWETAGAGGQGEVGTHLVYRKPKGL